MFSENSGLLADAFVAEKLFDDAVDLRGQLRVDIAVDASQHTATTFDLWVRNDFVRGARSHRVDFASKRFDIVWMHFEETFARTCCEMQCRNRTITYDRCIAFDDSRS